MSTTVLNAGIRVTGLRACTWLPGGAWILSRGRSPLYDEGTEDGEREGTFSLTGKPGVSEPERTEVHEGTAGEAGSCCTEVLSAAAAATWASEGAGDEEGRPMRQSCCISSFTAEILNRLPLLPFAVMGQSANVARRGIRRVVRLGLSKPSSATIASGSPKNVIWWSSMALRCLDFLAGQSRDEWPVFWHVQHVRAPRANSG